MQNKVVIRYQDGRLEKGITIDFSPSKDVFHITPPDAAPGAKPLEISVPELKAVFFVKQFEGNSQYNDKKEFEPNKTVFGRKIKMTFKDGEMLVGTTTGYDPTRPGFFILPADPQSNIERCFVVKSATKNVALF